MTEKELYELEAKVNEKVDRTRNEQQIYWDGVREGIAMLFAAIQDRITKQV